MYVLLLLSAYLPIMYVVKTVKLLVIKLFKLLMLIHSVMFM
jgi:hypothetical protein